MVAILKAIYEVILSLGAIFKVIPMFRKTPSEKNDDVTKNVDEESNKMKQDGRPKP